ncbi:MAG: polyphenol oxidase family protein [Vampirovibrio sp.]
MPPMASVLLDLYAQKLRYGFSTRPDYVAGTEADPMRLDAHRLSCLNAFGMNPDLEALTFPTQVHGREYIRVSQHRHAEVDAIWVDAPDSPAVVFSADCTPIILYAPDIHQGAVIHAGWKSTALGITSHLAKSLIHAGADPSQFIAVLGPALSLAGFEIEAPVLERLQASVPWDREGLWYQNSVQNPQRFQADVPFLNELQLRYLGVRRIERLAYATDTHPTLLWSFRAGDWQRQGTFLELLP